jgi:hypothetical protein
MSRKRVPIHYGFIIPDEGDPGSEISQRLFPNAAEVLLGGCVIVPGSPKTEKIYICGECKSASKKWNRDHSDDSG